MKNQFIVNAQTQFLRETIQHFNHSNRAVVGGGCIYSPTETSCGCAIGRHILNKGLCRELDSASGAQTGVGNAEVFAKIPGTLQVLGQDFLEKVQSLHDCADHWVETGLSLNGLVKVEKICTTFGLTL